MNSMRERVKRIRLLEVLIAVASGVLGLLLSPLLERVTSPFLATPTGALVAAFVLFSVLAIISIVMIGIFARRHENDMAKINVELSSINRRLGLTVRFVHDIPKRSTGEVYRVAREIIEKAEKEILVLQYNRPRDESYQQRAREIETEDYRNERQKYTQALLEKLQQHTADDMFYRRIYQFPEGRDTKFTEERVRTRLFEHTKAVLEVLKDYPDAGYIKKAPLFLEQTIVVVDDRYVIWGIDAIDPEHEVQYMEGALFFDDPHREFVRYLKSFIQRVDAHAIILPKVPEE